MKVQAQELLGIARSLMGSSKEYYLMNNVGHAKYTVNFHDGVKTNKDGSLQYDIKIFKNKDDLATFVKELHNKGYKESKPTMYR